MKRSYESIMGELAPSQQKAARIGKNAVIAAGAGSGKTRVLAARYLHLVIERKIPVDEILTLTFTRKAAAEMYSRIYATLRDTDHPLATEAVNAFHLARIDTIDAFCNSVARNACRNYGVSPDFSIDNDRAREIAEELALKFFLEKRRSPAIRQLMKRYSLAELPSRLFADTALRHSTVSSPPDFARWKAIQESEISARFSETSRLLAANVDRLTTIAGGSSKTAKQIVEALSGLPEIPAQNDLTALASFIPRCDRLAAIPLPGGRISDPDLLETKEILSGLKTKTYPEFLSTANYLLNRPIVEETFDLLSEFQERFNRQKRMEGVLTFPDVSRLALDALTDDPGLRLAYKESTSAIMIDEFQDDNAMQRDLLFLIAEKHERMERSVPGPDELCPDKLFFVGDEKQSIYRFRGADVSVFRALAKDLAGETADVPDLGTNYRTERALIESFNEIFPFVFVNEKLYPDGKAPMFEASFVPIEASRNTEGLKPALDVLLVNADNFTPDAPGELSPAETEAAEVADRIGKLIDSGYQVRDGDGTRPCTADDIAILFRSGTRQHLYERYLRERGIPAQSETLRGLFSDAPINDLHAILRLAVYPDDDVAYAITLRSPFVAVSDLAFTSAMLARVTAGENGLPLPAPFADGTETENAFGNDDAKAFARGRALFRKLQDMADRKSATEILTYLWYLEGYRYALLSDSALHRYLELYDYFFELARQSDERGEPLAAFLDRIQSLMMTGEKIEGLDIPVDRAGGVRLMTVHKSKGLEFPVVFLVDAGNEGRGTRNDAPVFFSEETGISVNAGGAEEAESARANYFYEKGREEERAREQAELRRLLYVAMTRAETRLFITGLFSGGGECSAEPRDADAIRALIGESLDKKDGNANKKGVATVKRSFLDLLFPALSSGPLRGVSLSEILPATRDQGSRAGQRAGSTPERNIDADKPSDILARYESAPLTEYKPSPQKKFSATQLHAYTDGRHATDASERDELDDLLGRLEVSANDFGTFAHRAIEARFTGIPAFMPEELRAETERMANRFLSSGLGNKAANATWRESEYGFITRYEHEGRTVSVTGQMDLVFEHEGTTYVVDYKTDRTEDPERHKEQLEVYKKAATDLRNTPVETWIFYLRSAHAVRI